MWTEPRYTGKVIDRETGRIVTQTTPRTTELAAKRDATSLAKKKKFTGDRYEIRVSESAAIVD